MNLKEIGKVLTSKSVGTGPSCYEKIIYRAAVSQKLRNTGLVYLRSKLASQIGEYVMTDIAFSLSLTFNYGLIESTCNRLKLLIYFYLYF